MNHKFRVWDKQRKVYLSDSSGPTIFTPYNFVANAFLEEDLVWEQWTGLSDKHDHDIYEGDFIKQINYHSNVILFQGVVRYSYPNAGFCIVDKIGDETGLGCAEITFEIYGNVNQNPKLL